jgi:hypothetical protein
MAPGESQASLGQAPAGAVYQFGQNDPKCLDFGSDKTGQIRRKWDTAFGCIIMGPLLMPLDFLETVELNSASFETSEPRLEIVPFCR